jgi:ATP-dependent helicase/nuclease subunit A
VELMPLVVPPESGSESAPSALRDPLAQPRIHDPNSAQLAEGRLIAERIESMVRARTPIQAAEGIRPVGYDDIVILLRGRTHAAAFERALREAAIPYSGIERGTLLDALEVQDLVALLQLLTAPHDDLALAQVLRSPIFDATDDDLIRLARTSGRSWMERLERVAIEEPTEAPLARAWRMLADWRSRAGSLPIHDLLDRVFHQADVIARYAAAVREDLAASVTANLQQFLELALEVDSGRYPSIVHFLGRLQGLQARGDEAPDSPPAAGAVPRVRLMTIHAAKGLESPVVFLADTATRPAGNRAYQTLVDWPARDERPRLMLMIGRGEDREDRQQSLLDADTGIERREQANLLYVALTRARQYLFLSGSGGSESTEEGWYEPLREAMARLGEPSAAGGHACECGSAPPIPVPTSSRPEEALSPLEAGLSTPLQPPSSEHEIAPSHLVHAGGGISDDVDARLRGVAVHRLLDRLSRTPGQPAPDIVETLAAELGLAPRAPELRAWLDEAQGLIGDPALEHLFEPSRFAEAWNEVPLIYTVDDRRVHGVIDRLIRFESRLLVLDYKTHRIEGPEQARALAERYAPQLGHYVAGVARLWPGLPVEAALLLTSTRRLVPVALERTAAAPHISKI